MQGLWLRLNLCLHWLGLHKGLEHRGLPLGLFWVLPLGLCWVLPLRLC